MFKTALAHPFVKRFWPVAVLLLLFLASIILRVPSFGLDPEAKNALTPYRVFNNTDVYIHNKYVIDIYEKYTVGEHMYSSYIGGGPYLQHKSLPLTVYTSFPATHFVVLYAVLKPLGMINTFVAWQIFGVVLQLICVLLLGYLVYVLTRNKWLAVLGASIYVFAAGALHFHMNAFWAHQLLQPIFIGSLVIFVKRRGIFKWWESLLIGFLLSIVAWTGAVAVVGYTLFAAYMFYKTRNKAYVQYLFMLAGMVLALLITFVHVLLVTGSDPISYLRAIKGRVMARSATGGLIPFPLVVWNYLSNLFLEYGGYMLLAYSVALRRTLKPFEWAVLFVASFPLIETFILLEHDTIYGFGRLKWIVPIVLVIVLFANRYVKTRKAQITLAAATGALHVVGVLLYYIIYWR